MKPIQIDIGHALFFTERGTGPDAVDLTVADHPPTLEVPGSGGLFLNIRIPEGDFAMNVVDGGFVMKRETVERLYNEIGVWLAARSAARDVVSTVEGRLERAAALRGAELYDKMQQPGVEDVLKRAFAASPEELGRAAVEAAKSPPTKWSWSTNEETWTQGADYDSREEAIAEANQQLDPGDTFWTGRADYVTPEQIADVIADVDVEDVVGTWLYDNVGEFASDDFNASKEQIDELQKGMREVALAWLTKHEMAPTCFLIEETERHTATGPATGNEDES